MNHILVVIGKWVFLVLGVTSIAGAAFASGSAVLPLIVIGLCLGTIGGGIVGYGRWSSKNEAQLKQHGRLVQADFQRVELNESLEINGSNPYRVVAQWHDGQSNQVHLFRSANLWFDPSNVIETKCIPVYIDPLKPSRYFMDLSLLLRLRGLA